MATANSTFTEIVTTTLRKRRKKLADNVTEHNALLKRLRGKGNSSLVDGGRELVEELEYAENSTFKYYSGYETLDIAPSEVFSAAKYDWKQAAVVVSWNGLEMRQNSGDSRLIDLIDKRIRNAEKTMINNIASGVYAAGTGSSGKEIGGLQHLVADAPATGIVGGINRANFSFWQNYDGVTFTATTANIQEEMNEAWLSLIRGTDKPDLIVADTVMFNFYWESLQTIQRITSAEKGEAGFHSLAYMGAPVVFDDQCPSKRMYFLNTDYLFFRTHKDANFSVLDERVSLNQDAFAVPVIWQGNMTMSNASLQGVIGDD